EIIEAQGQGTLHVPVWPSKTPEISLPPVWEIRVNLAGDASVLPLWCSHDVIIIVAADICLNAILALYSRIVIRIICNIADMQYPQWPSEHRVDPGNGRVDFMKFTEHFPASLSR